MLPFTSVQNLPSSLLAKSILWKLTDYLQVRVQRGCSAVVVMVVLL
jgi:hypothetical protein